MRKRVDEIEQVADDIRLGRRRLYRQVQCVIVGAVMAPTVMDLPRSAGRVSPPRLETDLPSVRSTPIPIPKHACMHWAFCKKSGCKWHA
jgi:hypothetical protein